MDPKIIATSAGLDTGHHTRPEVPPSPIEKRRLITRRSVLRGLGALSVGGVATYFRASYNATNLQFREQEIELAGITENLSRLHLCVFADQHIGGTIDSVVQKAQLGTLQLLDGKGPEDTLIIHPGDFVCGTQGGHRHTKFDEQYEQVASGLFLPLQTFDQYGIPGNHDGANPDWEDSFRPDIEEARGVQLLDGKNKVRDVIKANSQVRVIGVDTSDYRLHKMKSSDRDTEMDDLIDHLVNGEQELNVVILHNPDALEYLLDRLIARGESIEKPTIFLAGHTHGGMINIPFVRDYALGKADVYGDRYKGVYGPEGIYAGTGNWKMYVSTGMGNRPELGYRLLATPEVVDVRLV